MKKQKDPVMITVTHAMNTAGNWQIVQSKQIIGWDEFAGHCTMQPSKAGACVLDQTNPGDIIEFEHLSGIAQLTEDEYYDHLNEQLGMDGASWPEDEDWVMMRQADLSQDI